MVIPCNTLLVIFIVFLKFFIALHKKCILYYTKKYYIIQNNNISTYLYVYIYLYIESMTISGNWRLFKMRKNGLYLMLKAFFVLNETHKKSCVRLNLGQEFIDTETWLPLTFFSCLQNQWISITFYSQILKKTDVWKMWFIK